VTAIAAPSSGHAHRPRLPLVWVTWRQHGMALVCALGLLLATAIVLAIARADLAATVASIGPRAWPSVAVQNYSTHYPDVAMQAIPLLVGVFLGVPLAGRDMTLGTASVAWTQGTPRVRWLLGKLATVAIPLSAAAVGFGLLFGWFFDVYIPAVGRWGMSAFALYPPAFVGWTLVGLTLGVAAGAIFRNESRGIAVTILGWVLLHRVQPFAGPHAGREFWPLQFFDLGWLLLISLALAGVAAYAVTRPLIQGVRLVAPRPLRFRQRASMLGVTWRQHRGILLAAMVLFGATALALTTLRVHTPEPAELIIPLLLPFVLGAFAGAQVMAREWERGTTAFAWTQGVSRGTWVVGKLLRLGGLLAAGALVVGLAFEFSPFAADRMGEPAFGLFAPVYVGWTLAAFALGAFLGCLMREGAAIVLTAFITILVAAVNAKIFRPLWLPSVTGPAAGVPPRAPIFSLYYARPDGRPVSDGTMAALAAQAKSLHVSVGRVLAEHHVMWDATYLPASRFWPLQGIEAGGLLVIAVLLGAGTLALANRW